jgi:S-adenosylmethionine-diacylgycerolhomoserine-N-methlytransferase
MNGSSDAIRSNPADPAEPMLEGAAALTRYYRWHARLYDATRWSFLFGRANLIRSIADHQLPSHILEIGCGTGANILRLTRQFPDATVTGLDLSSDMLARARRKIEAQQLPVTLLQRCYDRPLATEPAFDLVVFSYCLSMIDPGWEQAIEAAISDLRPGGVLAVVDFHDTRLAGFRNWMAFNHVRMDGHLLPHLNGCCQPVAQTLRAAYGGIWRYFAFIGRKLDG